MKVFVMLGISFLLPGISSAQCPGAPRNHAQLQWSQAETVVSPNRVWQVEVHPLLNSVDNETPVLLYGCQQGQSWRLFTLERDANLYWSPDSKYLLIINAPLSGTNKLLLFSINRLITGTQSASGMLDKIVNEALLYRLGGKKHVQFYLPTYVSWKGNRLLFAVGGETYTQDVGPTNSFCYGVVADNDMLQLKSVISEKQLTAESGNGCQISP